MLMTPHALHDRHLKSCQIHDHTPWLPSCSGGGPNQCACASIYIRSGLLCNQALVRFELQDIASATFWRARVTIAFVCFFITVRDCP